MEDQKVAPFDTVTPTPADPTMTDLPTVPDPAAYPPAAADPAAYLPASAGPASYGDDAAYADHAAHAARAEPPAGGEGPTAPQPVVPLDHRFDHRAGIARPGDPVAVWPCAGCGRPVPQPVRGARTVR
ncbi:hypothetical protein [Actinomadura fibrosa]|nr:hypothetical protein [Actinomadura fibrosa]